MGHGRRQILWFGVTAHPTAEWIANQVREACGWQQAPRYLIRDRDGVFGELFVRRLRSMVNRAHKSFLSLLRVFSYRVCEWLLAIRVANVFDITFTPSSIRPSMMLAIRSTGADRLRSSSIVSLSSRLLACSSLTSSAFICGSDIMPHSHTS
jgi:hypothetical protein